MKLKGIAIAVTAVVFGVLLLAQSQVQPEKSASFRDWQQGDIIFQESISPQCEAIQLASHSPWSHVGIVLVQKGEWVVLEAIHPVCFTPLNEFIGRGTGHYLVKRVTDEHRLTPEQLLCMYSYGLEQEGKYYDLEFEWNDERMYCSELVYKLYLSCTGLALGTPKPLGAFDLSHPVVKEVMDERYENDIPIDELMIAPGGIAESPLLQTIWEAPQKVAKFSK